MATYDVRVGDVWRSKAGRNAVVEEIQPNVPRFLNGDLVTKVLARLKTGAGLLCEIGNFVKGRTLVERGGVRVGDVWRDGLDHYRVESLSGDDAVVDGPHDRRTMALADLAAMRLVERDGKAV